MFGQKKYLAKKTFGQNYILFKHFFILRKMLVNKMFGPKVLEGVSKILRRVTPRGAGVMPPTHKSRVKNCVELLLVFLGVVTYNMSDH